MVKRILPSLLALGALGASVASCAPPEPFPTLRVAVSTDLATPGAFDGLTIHVERTGMNAGDRSRSRFHGEYTYDTVQKLPDSLMLYQDASLLKGDESKWPITVRVVALRRGKKVVVRSAQLPFLAGEVRLLRMPLCASCLGKTCEDGKTCKAGRCVDQKIDPATLPIDDGAQPLEDPECPAPASICEGRCGEPGCGECPQDPMVLVPQLGYSIDAHEVTRAAYEQWLAQNPHPPDENVPKDDDCRTAVSYWPDPDCLALPEVCTESTCQAHPQVCVPVCAAAAYCRWAGKRLCGRVGGGPVSLDDGPPEQSEWFRACAGPSSLPFPYGDTYQSNACNDTSGTTTPVASMPACTGAVPGVYDMVGNVHEWENNCDGASCIVRGGDYANGKTGCGTLAAKIAIYARPDVGFRCCADD